MCIPRTAKASRVQLTDDKTVTTIPVKQNLYFQSISPATCLQQAFIMLCLKTVERCNFPVAVGCHSGSRSQSCYRCS